MEGATGEWEGGVEGGVADGSGMANFEALGSWPPTGWARLFSAVGVVSRLQFSVGVGSFGA